MKMLDHNVVSCDGIHTLAGVVYVPEEKPVGILQVVHGMTEYIGRYHRFMADMAKAGWVVCGHDHLGHGRTAADPSEWGYIASENGWDLLCRDAYAFGASVRDAYGRELPYVLMGHSMGSFVARITAARYITPEDRLGGLIIMGTGGPNPAAALGITLARLIRKSKGEKHVSKLIDALAFGGYQKPFKEEQDPYAWLTTDLSVRDAYRRDPLCTFPFTVSAMGDLIRLTKEANAPAWFDALPADLPILLVSGENDPVGGMGKGVNTVYRKLKRAGKRVTCYLYHGYRHEILNDDSYDLVTQNMRDFLNACM